ncbi:MAG TPA: ABC transporter permease [Gemmatimonadales bacterium]|jgi:ABC-2 type transport system permease protein
MNKLFAVIRREFIARVRTKAFMISTVILPVFIVAITIVPALMMRGSSRTMHIAIADGTTDSVGNVVAADLKAITITPGDEPMPAYTVDLYHGAGHIDALRDSLVSRTARDRAIDPATFDGVLVITDATTATGKADYLGANTSSIDAMNQLESTLSHVLMTRRLERSGVDPKLVAGAMTRADLSTTKVSDGKATGQSGAESFAIAYFMGFLLYFVVTIYGQQTLTSVIEEKSSRIMEVLASSLRPFQMLLGKVIGVGSVGLFQMTIWAATFFFVSRDRAQLAGLFHVSPAAMQQLPIPTMPVGLLVVFLVYFVLGFLLYGALYAAIGSMCNTVKDAQQYMMLVTMVLVFGFFGVFALMRDPTGSFGVTLSIVPFVSQFAMPVRWSLAAVPAVQLVMSLIFSVIALLGVTWLAGRIYRTGILMYGKKPTLVEVARWIRAK